MKLRGGSNKLSKLYYSTGGYWKGYSAISKLADAAKVSEDEAGRWLERQALWQIYLPAPRYIPGPLWRVDMPNKIHQADLLFLPHDTFKKRTYRYVLVVVDIASRYKDAEALTSKESSEVAKAFERIYARRLGWPEVLMVDPGREFMGDVTRLMSKHEVTVQRSEAGNHRAQAFVERANRTLGEKIFSHQYAQEMVDVQVSKSRSRELVERLPAVLKTMNNDQQLPPSVKVRYLFAPSGGEGGEKRRATDPLWSLEIFDLSRSIVSVGQPVLYYLSEGAPRELESFRSFLKILSYLPILCYSARRHRVWIPSSHMILLPSS